MLAFKFQFRFACLESNALPNRNYTKILYTDRGRCTLGSSRSQKVAGTLRNLVKWFRGKIASRRGRGKRSLQVGGNLNRSGVCLFKVYEKERGVFWKRKSLFRRILFLENLTIVGFVKTFSLIIFSFLSLVLGNNNRRSFLFSIREEIFRFELGYIIFHRFCS